MRTAFFWVIITQRVVVIFADVRGKSIGLIFRGQEFFTPED
jgi:hypothetical protein